MEQNGAWPFAGAKSIAQRSTEVQKAGFRFGRDASSGFADVDPWIEATFVPNPKTAGSRLDPRTAACGDSGSAARKTAAHPLTLILRCGALNWLKKPRNVRMTRNDPSIHSDSKTRQCGDQPLRFEETNAPRPRVDSPTTPNGTIALVELRGIFARHGQKISDEEGGQDLQDALTELLSNFTDAGLDALEVLLAARELPAPEASEALRAIGDVQDVHTVERRRILLERFLTSEVPAPRYGALFGLLRLRSVQSAALIREAIQKENVLGLKRDMERVLRRLEQPAHADVRPDH